MDFNYEKKKIALIGSGATAVSLLAPLAARAAEVTIVQRSPSYIAAFENRSRTCEHVPLFVVIACRRLYWIIMPCIFVLFCQCFPKAVRDMLQKKTVKLLPGWVEHDPHFKPRYNPWEQRLCFDPDGRFYGALHRPNVKVVTGKIESITESGIQIQDSRTIEADVIVTATGLNMKLGGDIDMRINGKTVPWSKRFIWNGSMVDGIPNMIFMLGYTNHSWTLGADNTAIILGRLWAYMARNGMRSAVPRVPQEATEKPKRLWQLSATYVTLAEDKFPICGNAGLWKPRACPLLDYVRARWGDYTSGLRFSA
ncbi:hypothetical protein DL764_000858 [Monosporascus ibericus]|uniref:FAD/NAD(P)-binding domain-containing protein n=1 Tax=Monosporascus ibericus TaxID=155417 RepID=A0A4Q4TTN1_9PEZI|nr:hypothetical protein DL764_000858 [Monosporascus ibericus]